MAKTKNDKTDARPEKPESTPQDAAATAESGVTAAPPAAAEPIALVGVVRRYAISLPHTCGKGTIRPPFHVVIAMTGAVGSAQVIQPLDPEWPNAGVRVTLPRPTDLFAAGEQTRAIALEAFNRHYNIRATENEYTVQAIEDEPSAEATPAEATAA
jgi:hypothetical protein